MLRGGRFIRWRVVRDRPIAGRLSAAGLCLGAFFFAVSLSPSMIPRAGMLQGMLGGICFAAGYFLGWAGVALWLWLSEADPRPLAVLRRNTRLALVVAVGFAVWGLWNATGWQNGIHEVMGLPPVESARPFLILGVAIAVAGVLLLVGRLFRRLAFVVRAQIEPFLPRRVALFIGIVTAGLLFWAVGNDFVISQALRLMDDTYAALDEIMPLDDTPPPDAWQTGSDASLIAWESLGAAGREWVKAAPGADAIAATGAGDARAPLRVYVGLNSAPTIEARAALALEEALRVGAFDRAVLVLATPTGTGWMDPAAFGTLDHLAGGDVATIAVQYSYLPSWLSLIVQPEYGAESARALFRAVHDYWRRLPEDTRPRLYLFGLSLGALNGGLSTSLADLVAAAPQGELWVGPPFAMADWQQVLRNRLPQSSAWAPVVGDGSMIRVTTQDDLLSRATAPWGPMRIVYLAYPSDPVAFFEPSILWRAPDWLAPPRAPDVSHGLRWYPVVTFLQMAFDMMAATSAPEGHGHVYAAGDYLVAWNGVLGMGADRARLARIEAAVEEANRALDLAGHE